MPYPPSGSQFLANVGDSSAWYLTTDTGGVDDTKIYSAAGVLLANIANGDAAGALGYLQVSPQLFFVDLAGGAGGTVIYATDDTPAGTAVVTTVSHGTASPFTSIASREVYQVTTAAPASATIGGTLYHYTVYTSTLYTTDATPRSPQAIAQVSYGTPFDETDGGFSLLSTPSGGLFTATASTVATGPTTTLYETDGTPGGTDLLLPDIASATGLGSVGGLTLFNVVVGGDTEVDSVDASGNLKIVLTLDGVYAGNLSIDQYGNEFITETDGTGLNFYATDGTAAGTQLLLTAPDATSVTFLGRGLGIDFYLFSGPTGQELYETQATPATTHLITTAPPADGFAISPLTSLMEIPPEGTMVVVSELVGDNVVKQVWVNALSEAVAPAGDEYVWIGPLSGEWGTPSNWEDATRGTDPATVAPGSSDSVTFDSPADQFQIIGGTGASAYLTMEGENTVTGALTTGDLWVSGYVGELQIDQGGSIAAGFGLVDFGVTIDVGALSFSNSLAIDDPHINDTNIDTVVTVTDGRLDVGGMVSISNNSLLFADDHSRIQIGALATSYGGALNVDATSSIEVGDAGGAALGALTVDAGATLSITGSSTPLLGIGDIIDNGLITVTGLGSFPVPVGLLSNTDTLSGAGRVVVGDDINAVIGGPVLDGSLAFQIDNDGTLTLDAVGAGNSIALNGNGVVALDGQPTSGNVLAFAMDAAIGGFDASDMITINSAITNATYTAGSTAGTGALALTDGATLVATVNLDGDYAGDTFLVTPTSSSVWDVTLFSGALTVLAPAAAVINFGQADPIVGLGLAERGASGRVSVTLSDEAGLLTANGAGVTLTGSGTTSLTISGGLAQVNAALATVADRNTATYFDTLTLTARDADGNTATRVVAQTLAVTPVVQAPVSATVVLGQAVAIGGVSIAEAGGTAGESFTVTLQDQRGLLAATGLGVSGSGTVGGLTVTGTLAQVNAALATLTDSVRDGAPDKILVFATDGNGNHADAANIVVDVNGKPALAAPAAATVGVGLATRIAGISLSESGTTVGERFTVTLSDTAGLLTANGAGVTLTGAGTTSLTITGALPQVNAALATLSDTAPNTASDSITLSASDSDGGAAAAGTIPVTVSGVASPAATASIRATALHLGGTADPAWGTGEGGVTVSLLNGMGAVIATAVTTSAGQASFGNLAPGTYQLKYTAPAGQGFVPGGPDNAAGVTVPVTVAAGQALVGPSGDLMATLVLNGAGLTATPAAGGYVVTGNAADSTLTLGNFTEYVTLTGGGDRVTTGNGNETITLAGAGNIVTVGVGNSVIDAGSGGAMVQAAGGDVTITAAGAGNRLDGGSGLSFLNTDGSANNVFVLGAAGTPTANMTTVSGFDAAAGDILDLKNTLAATNIYADLPDIASYITAVAAGPNTVLLSDLTATPIAFATLLNTHVSIAQLQALNAFSVT